MFSAVLVKVNVHMRLSVMLVSMQVDVRPLAKDAQHRQHAKQDNHQGHAKLQPVSNREWDGHTKTQHQHPHNNQRRRVACSPQRADQCSAQDIAMFADNCRDGYNVIDFSRVLQTKDESEAKYGEHANRCE